MRLDSSSRSNSQGSTHFILDNHGILGTGRDMNTQESSIVTQLLSDIEKKGITSVGDERGLAITNYQKFLQATLVARQIATIDDAPPTPPAAPMSSSSSIGVAAVTVAAPPAAPIPAVITHAVSEHVTSATPVPAVAPTIVGQS